MLSLFGKFLGKVPLQFPSPQPNFITQFNPIRGFSSGKVKPYVGDNRNIADFFRRKLAAKHELRRKLYKAMWRDTTLPEKMREHARYKLSKLPRNSAFNRVRNRCIFTGRARAVYQQFRMSRICFRERALQGELHGVKKASW